jgi:hypothetical protein
LPAENTELSSATKYDQHFTQQNDASRYGVEVSHVVAPWSGLVAWLNPRLFYYPYTVKELGLQFSNYCSPVNLKTHETEAKES